MPPEIEKELAALRQKIEQVYLSVERTRKYFLWTLIITLVLFILPLVALVFVIPSFLSLYTTNLGL